MAYRRFSGEEGSVVPNTRAKFWEAREHIDLGPLTYQQLDQVLIRPERIWWRAFRITRLQPLRVRIGGFLEKLHAPFALLEHVTPIRSGPPDKNSK